MFNLRETPTLQVAAHEDVEQLNEGLATRAHAALQEAEAAPEVVSATIGVQSATEHVGRCKRAGRTLNAHASQLGDFLRETGKAYLNELIEQAADGGTPDQEKLNHLSRVEAESKLTIRAIEEVIAHRQPLAEIARMRAEAALGFAKADAIERLAVERAEKLVKNLQAAVGEEVVLRVDTRQGVAGMLMHLSGVELQAGRQAESAANVAQEQYDERVRKARKQ